MLNKCKQQMCKGIVHPNITVLSSFTVIKFLTCVFLPYKKDIKRDVSRMYLLLFPYNALYNIHSL